MKLPSIAYVDEVEAERDNFFNDAHDSGLFSSVLTLEPSNNLEDFVEEILELPIDAFITDFNLYENEITPYSGEDLVKVIREKRHGLPCFIRTSYEEDALKDSLDVNLIYSKNAKGTHGDGKSLLERVSKQISNYHQTLDTWQAEFEELRAISPEKITAQQVERILELDSNIERHIGGDTRLPDSLKQNLFTQRDNLIVETEKLLEDIKSTLER